MATCKDCLHEKACFKMLEAMGYKVSTDYEDGAERCDAYTPKPQYAEVKHGEWVFNRYSAPDEKLYFCSLCITGGSDYGYDNYCPNCGAKMDEIRKD